MCDEFNTTGGTDVSIDIGPPTVNLGSAIVTVELALGSVLPAASNGLICKLLLASVGVE